MTHSVLASTEKLSPAIQDYVKAIYILHQEYGQVTTTHLAEHLRFAPPSVTTMLQKLQNSTWSSIPPIMAQH